MQNAISDAVTLLDNVPNLTYINQIRTNATVFSAFKNHHQTKAIVDLLLDKDSNPVNWSTFKNEALKVSKKYNIQWLKTEYNTARSRAAVGAKFVKFQATKHLYPNLKWTPSRSEQPREIHKKYYGLILPIDDAFWINNFPGNEWNCKCGIQRSKAPVGKIPTGIKTPPEGLEGNPAFTGKIIGLKHPYYKGLNAIEKKGALNTVQRQIEQNLKIWAKENIDAYLGLKFKAKQAQMGFLTLMRKDIKTLNRKVSDPVMKTYATVLKQDSKNWEYIGYSKVIDGKHANALVFTYYKTEYAGTTIYINARITTELVERPYSIVFNIDKSKIIRKPVPVEITKGSNI